MEDLQGFSPLVAGLALLPQGVVTGVGLGLGTRVAACWGTRLSALLGLAILTVGTAALLLLTATTPAWATATILCARGVAVGLTIRPLLDAMIAGLAREEIADGNTLFNVTQRLGASIGISLLATFFATRERVRVDDAMHALDDRAQRLGAATATSAAHLPAPVRARLAEAAVAGFHDTIWALVGLSALGVCAAVLVRDHRAAEGEAPARHTKGAA